MVEKPDAHFDHADRSTLRASPRRSFFRDNGLTLALAILFILSLIGMIATGQADLNETLEEHGSRGMGLLSYVASGHFLSGIFENWESEFLQMATYVVLTAFLFQRGSAESLDPDEPPKRDDDLDGRADHRIAAWFYSYSLGLTLAALFALYFALHCWFSYDATTSEAILHGSRVVPFHEYLTDPHLWFESFQNWQSEFLSTGLLVVLSIFLRQKHSPESKPVNAPHSQTGS